MVRVKGPRTVKSATHSRSLTLVAAAELPVMNCVAFDLASAKMSFQWYVVHEGQSCGSLLSLGSLHRVSLL